MPDTFEKTFSELVENRLQEEAPFLMEHSVGFEIKDKDEDGTKGMGVYAFMINSVPAYVPIVYNKGDLEGFELLWLAKQRMMVPATSHWVDTIRDKSENVFGEVVNKPEVRIKATQQPEGTTLDSGTFPYAIKTAEQDGGDVGPDIIKGMLSGTRSDALVSGILKEAIEDNPEAVAVLCKTALENPEYADTLQQMYPDGSLHELVRQAQDKLSKQAEEDKKTPVKRPGIKTITDIDDPDAQLLTTDQKKKLMKTGSFILDNRDEHSTVFTYKTASDLFSNPNSNGFCRVLGIDGNLHDAWVSLMKYPSMENYAEMDRREQIDNPSGTSVLTVFRSEPKKGYIFPLNRVYATDFNGIEGFDIGNKVQGKSSLPEVDAPGSLGIIDKSGGTYKFPALRSDMIMSGYPEDAEVSSGRNSWRLSGRPFTSHECDVKEVDVQFTDQEDVDIRVGRRIMTIGPAARAVRILCDSGTDFRPGDPHDFENLDKTAGMSKVDIKCEGPAMSTKVDGRYSGLSNTEREFRRLVFDIGVHPGSARTMMKQAQDDGEASYLVKKAGAVEAMSSDPDITVVKYETPQATEVQHARESGMLLQEARNTAQRASDAGNDDLFEITSLRGLMEVVEDKSLKRNSFVKLMRGMDECGRNLFRLYWKKDEMLEEYGSEDVDKLEDSLKNNFKSMGELVLFLQDKFTSLHSPFQNSMDGLLIEGENQADAGGIE